MNHNDYFDSGFKVFGLHGVDADGVCGCGNEECQALFKHPRISNWQHTPQWADEQVEVMEMTGQFDTGFGVLCDGYLIIDIDPRNGGNEGYAALVSDTGVDYKKESGLVVATGGGGWHIYFKHEGNEKLNGKIKKYKGVDFKSSGFVVGAGSMHKSGSCYEVEKGHSDDVGTMPEKLFDLLVKRVNESSFNVSDDETTEAQIADYLSFIKCYDEYEDWVQIGMAIHEALCGDGFDLWVEWSKQSASFDYNGMESKWHSFGKHASPVTVGTLKAKASEGGYIEPVTFVTDLTYEVDQLDTNDINLKKATGLVGQCIDYINSCSRFPRENLAVSAALSAVSNIAGMKFKDTAYGANANLFCFNVAGSATGKEAIQQAHGDLTIAGGVAKAIYGTIKSEQEIYRNVIRHQLTGYVIDEFGITLNKIEQASKTGASSYLGGVVGALMSIYSKADGNLPLGSDFAIELKKDVGSQIAAIEKMKSENTAKEHHLRKLESLLSLRHQIQEGYIERPFLTLSGYTTPATFNNLVSYAQATNGFIGRALLFEEPDNNPRAKKNFSKPDLPMVLEHELKKLATLGAANSYEDCRIECSGDLKRVETTQDACNLLDDIQNELHDKAAHAMETNGLEAIVRRSFELVLKISFVLAIGDKQTRTVEHVRWSYALVKRDVETKINLTGANMAQEEKNMAEELLSKVKHKLDKNHGASIGTIANKLRSLKKEHIQKALDHLVSSDEARKEEKTPKRGKPSVIYFSM